MKTTNDATRASAEAMPTINRRRFLTTTATAGVAVAVAAPVAAVERPMTPDERIDAAVEEIKTAFWEKWPDAPLRINDCDNIDRGMIIIVSHVANDQPGEVRHDRGGLARLAKGGAK